MINRYLHKLRKKLGLIKSYRSETDKMRPLTLPYCEGYGCDIGFGGDKIKSDAVGIDYATPYTSTGSDAVDLACDVINEDIPVADSTFDYVYSSHLIEDLPDTVAGLKKFIRVLKSGGTLILVFPDQQVYERICKQTGQPLNQYHKQPDMGFAFMEKAIQQLEGIQPQLLFKSDCEIDYNVVMVYRIDKV